METLQHQSITELNQIHKQLEELFYHHQVAILKSDIIEADILLKKFEKALFHHMHEEDEILLPLYRQRATAIRGGDPDTFSGEHKKMAEWLNRIKLRLQRLSPMAPDLKSILALLDDEAQFKKYAEHHTLREDHVFYPELDRLVDEKEKLGLLRLLTFSVEEMAETT
jgi:iron-sulfur cluster repair protein YtfE (RIC family)